MTKRPYVDHVFAGDGPAVPPPSSKQMNPTDMLNLLAHYREDYAGSGPYESDIRLQVDTIRCVAKILAGDRFAAMGLIPSWKWASWEADTGMDMTP